MKEQLHLHPSMQKPVKIIMTVHSIRCEMGMSQNHRINHLGWKTPPTSSRTAPRVPNTNAPAVPQPANSRPGAQLSQGAARPAVPLAAATEGGGDARPPGT